MLPMDIAMRLLKEEPLPYNEYGVLYDADAHEADPDGYMERFHRARSDWYMRNPIPPPSRDDFSKVKQLHDEHGVWPPPVKDYPDLSDKEFDEFDNWERYNSHLSDMEPIHEKDRQVKEKDMRDKQEWDDVLAEGKELGIYISQGELNQKDTDAMRQRVEAVKHKGEPMDIAFQLLKHPVQTTLPQFARNMGPPVMAMRGMSPDRAKHAIAYGLRASPKYPVDNKPMVWSVGGTGPHSQREAKQYGSQLVGIREGAFPAIPHDVGSEGTPIYAHPGNVSPSDLVMLMLKHATSPEALAHKVDYDTKYETTPERVKYRSDLKQARRLRHIAGKGGPDMSHTQSGSIVAEDPHTNRARHFKERGTLKPN